MEYGKDHGQAADQRQRGEETGPEAAMELDSDVTMSAPELPVEGYNEDNTIDPAELLQPSSLDDARPWRQ